MRDYIQVAAELLRARPYDDSPLDRLLAEAAVMLRKFGDERRPQGESRDKLPPAPQEPDHAE